MFQRFHEIREREGGFTLIELLVVILIVAILAAVAIPVFLNQRKKGYVDQMESALKNAATVAESHATGNNGVYPVAGAISLADGTYATGPTATAFKAEGYNPTNQVVLSFSGGGTTGAYCLLANHELHDDNYIYLSAEGRPKKGTVCP